MTSIFWKVWKNDLYTKKTGLTEMNQLYYSFLPFDYEVKSTSPFPK